jgi:hypothetical protein
LTIPHTAQPLSGSVTTAGALVPLTTRAVRFSVIAISVSIDKRIRDVRVPPEEDKER